MKTSNPIIYIEIPVLDMDRAIDFYQTVLDCVLEREVLDGYEMAHFPFHSNQGGASGSLVKGDVYKPTKDGVILYFYTNDIEQTLERARKFDSEILYPKTINTDLGYAIAEISDSEGNRIALKQLITS
ncbi:VOC family protein [Sphingobacterium corticibacter]|uniref:VOC family protein n=1 Tax=Sphingobacterium corticibacter TaxID=2171749 RepID=A0A2T8HG87_9SPHI|nr:VOC family protein [Sphingobacterium corticibacter]PVH24423.1 VOC family protein [Sphingobacterium corticibacter]